MMQFSCSQISQQESDKLLLSSDFCIAHADRQATNKTLSITQNISMHVLSAWVTERVISMRRHFLQSLWRPVLHRDKSPQSSSPQYCAYSRRRPEHCTSCCRTVAGGSAHVNRTFTVCGAWLVNELSKHSCFGCSLMPKLHFTNWLIDIIHVLWLYEVYRV